MHQTEACGVHRELEYEDVWAMFGEGRHPHIEHLYDTKLAPFLSQSANHFWQNRLWYFKQGLYYQGGMVSALLLLQLWLLPLRCDSWSVKISCAFLRSLFALC